MPLCVSHRVLYIFSHSRCYNQAKTHDMQASARYKAHQDERTLAYSTVSMNGRIVKRNIFGTAKRFTHCLSAFSTYRNIPVFDDRDPSFLFHDFELDALTTPPRQDTTGGFSSRGVVKLLVDPSRPRLLKLAKRGVMPNVYAPDRCFAHVSC